MNSPIHPQVMVLLLLLMVACGPNHYSPKPRGFHRIDLPEKRYQIYQEGCPFSFQYSEYSYLQSVPTPTAQSCWMDLIYPEFNATVHLSYLRIHTPEDLVKYHQDAHHFAFTHAARASTIDQIHIDRPEEAKHGLWYLIRGNVASSVQFFITDSTQHYLRGALYFNEKPQIDSLQPVINFIRLDMEHLVESLTWK